MFSLRRAVSTLPVATSPATTSVRRQRLRIGLVHDERLLTEQAFDPTETVTIGASPRDTIALPDVDYQGAALVFAPASDGGCAVCAPSEAQPRLALGDQVLDQQAAERAGVVTTQGAFLRFHVARNHRGRCQMGPYTVLFQVVEQTVDVPVLARPSFLQRARRAAIADPVWKGSLALSAGLLCSVVAQAEVWNRAHGRFLQTVPEESVAANWQPEPERLHVIAVAELQPPPDAAPEKPGSETAPAATTPKAPKAGKTRAIAQPVAAASKASADTDRPARVLRDTIAGGFRQQGSKLYQESDDASAETAAAGAFGDKTARDASASPGADSVRVHAATPGSATRVKTVAGTFGERDKHATADDGAPKQETQVVVRTSPPVGPEDGKADVAKALRGKAAAVQRCYEQELRANPSVQGKVTVTFTVGSEGTVTDSAVAGTAGTFAECIQSVFARLRGLPLLKTAATFSQSYVFSKAQ